MQPKLVTPSVTDTHGVDVLSAPGLAIMGLGTAQPAHLLQTQACELAKSYNCQSQKQERVLEGLYRKTEINKRSTVLADVSRQTLSIEDFFRPVQYGASGPGTQERMRRYAQDVVPLAVSAVQAALQAAGIGAGQITHLITVSCTGFFAPGLDISLIAELGLPATVARYQVGFMGCHGALNAIGIATSIAAADRHARIVICAAELCSLHFQYGWNSDDLVANSLFADGAAAIIAAHDSAAPASSWKVTACGSKLIPNCREAMTWRIGNHGFSMTLSPELPQLIGENLPSWMAEWLGSYKLNVGQIGSWAVHPGGPRVLDAVQSSLELSSQALAASRQVLAECGNMSSPTVLFIIQRLQAISAPRPCVVLGFGPGLVMECALLT